MLGFLVCVVLGFLAGLATAWLGHSTHQSVAVGVLVFVAAMLGLFVLVHYVT